MIKKNLKDKKQGKCYRCGTILDKGTLICYSCGVIIEKKGVLKKKDLEKMKEI